MCLSCSPPHFFIVTICSTRQEYSDEAPTNFRKLRKLPVFCVIFNCNKNCKCNGRNPNVYYESPCLEKRAPRPELLFWIAFHHKKNFKNQQHQQQIIVFFTEASSSSWFHYPQESQVSKPRMKNTQLVSVQSSNTFTSHHCCCCYYYYYWEKRKAHTTNKIQYISL
jgi:hypothetical protein